MMITGTNTNINYINKYCNFRYFYGTNVNICNCTKGFTGNMCEVPLSDYLPDGERERKCGLSNLYF
jgi:hypothetical protein